MKNTERLYAIANEELSVRTPKTIRELAIKFEVSENTVKGDLRELEVLGACYCANPNGKPQLWFAVNSNNNLKMSLELAFALQAVNETIKAILPDEVYQSIEEVFGAAQATYQKKRNANHQSNVVKFERGTNGIDLKKHLALNNIQLDVLSAVKSALCSNRELSFETDLGAFELSNASLSELDGKLFIKGMMAGRRYQVETSKIIKAGQLELRPAWKSKSREFAVRLAS